MPKVSVIIPSHNRFQDLIRKSLPSVQKQTFSDLEIIIMDDCSEEDYSQIEIGGRVKYFRNQINKGKSYSVNFAIKQAKGEYILVVDDDNELMPTYLEETVALIERKLPPEVANDGFYHPQPDAIQVGRIIRHDGFDDYAPPINHTGYGFSAIDWGWLIKREVFEKIQYDESLSGDEDADFGIQFFQHFDSRPLNKPLTIAYAQGDGVSFPSAKRLQSLDRFITKNIEFYNQAGPKDLSFLYRFAARNYYLAGYKQQANNLFWLAFKAYPNRRTLTHYLVSLINYRAYYQLMRLEEKYYARKRMASAVVADSR